MHVYVRVCVCVIHVHACVCNTSVHMHVCAIHVHACVCESMRVCIIITYGVCYAVDRLKRPKSETGVQRFSLGVWHSFPALRGVQLKEELVLRGIRKLIVSLHGVHLLHLISIESRHHCHVRRVTGHNCVGLGTGCTLSFMAHGLMGTTTLPCFPCGTIQNVLYS